MKNLDKIGEELFNKIRGRFPSVTIGDEAGNITNIPSLSRFYDFKFETDGKALGSISISLDEDKGITVLYSNDIAANEDTATRNNWYNFLKELRVFSRKRLLNFNTRDITKSNLNKRDYKFLANNKAGEDKMNESKLYGTSRVSYQDVDNARLVIKHTESVNAELATGRTQKIGSIFVDNAQGERFKYPYKHLAGARAMARHVAEGGNPHDDFGKHIVGLSEELAKLRKFKNYMGRSAVMAESLADYMDVVKERVATVKKTIESLQKKSFYSEAFESFEAPVLEEVPADVAENWIDELTIRQFNEELKDVFPYIYKLVSEATKARELGPLDLEGYSVYEGEDKKCSCCGDTPCSCDESCPECGGKGMYEATIKESDCPCCDGGRGTCSHGKEVCGTCGGSGKVRESVYDEELEQGFEEMMGQFAEGGECYYCNGDDPDCEHCEGSGYVKDMDEGFDPDEFEGEFDYDAVGDDGEEDSATVTYKANIDDMGRPVVDPKSIKVHASGNNPSSKLGYDVDSDTEMQDMKELLQMAQEDADEMWDSRDNKYAHGEGEKKDHDDDGDIDSDDYMKAKDIAIKKAMGKDKKEKKTPLGEFILSHFDKETGEFPKGETAVLTMIEKDYGDKFIEPAKQFIERIYQTCEEFEMAQNPQQIETDREFDRMRELAGLR